MCGKNELFGFIFSRMCIICESKVKKDFDESNRVDVAQVMLMWMLRK